MRYKRVLLGIVAAVGLGFFLHPSSVFATGSITSISLSSNKVTPGFEMEFTLHTEPNVRQNVNTSEAVEIPDGWTVEISKNDQYPAGVWGVYRILLPENNITEHDNNVYSFEVAPDESHYRIRLQDSQGNFYASEVFEVTSESFVTIQPGRAFEQGENVVFRIYNEDGEPWNIDNWGNAQGLYNIDVFYFGNGGPISYASGSGNTPVHVERTGNGTYSFPAGQVITEYYLDFFHYPSISEHSSSFNVVAASANDNTEDNEDLDDTEESEDEPEEDEPELPPVLEPYEDDSETDSENNPDVPQPEREETVSFSCPLQIGKAYKARGSSAVYLIGKPHLADGKIDTSAKKCTKRAFTNSGIFFTYFDSWSEVLVDDRVNLIAEDKLKFLPLGKNYDPKYGALVKVVSDPKVYLLLGDTRYWITSESVFTELNYSWSWVEDVSEDLLLSYNEGSEITDLSRHPNYTLIQYRGDSRVYRLEPDPSDSTRTVKRHIANEESFNSLGYRWDRIVTVRDSEKYSDGEPLSSERRIILRAR